MKEIKVQLNSDDFFKGEFSEILIGNNGNNIGKVKGIISIKNIPFLRQIPFGIRTGQDELTLNLNISRQMTVLSPVSDKIPKEIHQLDLNREKLISNAQYPSLFDYKENYNILLECKKLLETNHQSLVR